MGSRDKVVLENVDFISVDCRNVIFSKFNPVGGLDLDWADKFISIKDCTFIESNLSGAIFKGAYLEWTETHPDQLGEWIEDGAEDRGFLQTHYPAFFNTDLSTTSFAESVFKNADFREASGILQCDFRRAKGLETCLFDDEDTKQAVLSLATERDKGATEPTR